MYTPVPGVIRSLNEPVSIEGVRLPAGTVIDVHTHLMHHNPAVWENHMVCILFHQRIGDLMTCDLRPFRTMRVIVKGCIQWNPFTTESYIRRPGVKPLSYHGSFSRVQLHELN